MGCEPGYLAMFAYPGLREAALANFDASQSIDWVLAPYTAYVRPDGTLIWITDSVPLLGVRDGGQEDLLASILPVCANCFAELAPTGIAPGWTTDNDAPDAPCDQWSSAGSEPIPYFGKPESTSLFLRDPGFDGATCDFQLLFFEPYCVEQ